MQYEVSKWDSVVPPMRGNELLTPTIKLVLLFEKIPQWRGSYRMNCGKSNNNVEIVSKNAVKIPHRSEILQNISRNVILNRDVFLQNIV